jgi:hypothetical protein
MRAQHLDRVSLSFGAQLVIAAGLLDVLYMHLAVAANLLGVYSHAYLVLLVLVFLAARGSKIAWAVLMSQNALSFTLGAVAVVTGGIAGIFTLQLASVLTAGVALAVLLSRAVRNPVS